MNKRIQELFDKAVSDVDYIRDDEYTNLELQKMYIPDCFAERFAELIVQECLTFVRPNRYFQAYPDNMIGGEDGVRLLETITNQIEEHFGVEQ